MKTTLSILLSLVAGVVGCVESDFTHGLTGEDYTDKEVGFFTELTLASNDLSPFIVQGIDRNGGFYHSSGMQTDLDGAFDMIKNAYFSETQRKWFYYDNTRPVAIWELDSQGDAAFYYSPPGLTAPSVAPAYLRIRGNATFGSSKAVQLENNQAGGEMIFAVSVTENAPSEVMRLTPNKNLVVKNNLGIGGEPYTKFTIRNSVGTNHQFSFSSDAVVHPFTGLVNTHIASLEGLAWTDNGGSLTQGFTDADRSAAYIQGHVGSTLPTSAAVVISGYKASGTTRASMAGDEKVLSITAGDGPAIVSVTASGKVLMGGGELFVEGGALKFKGSAGTVTTLALP